MASLLTGTTIAANIALHAGNYNSYALPLTGGAITGNSTFSADNYLTFGPNSSWSRYLRIGGNGYTAPVTTTASVVTTDGNLHLDAAKAAKGIYLNWYGGTSGTIFGNGSGTQVGVVDGSGNASFIGALGITGAITGASFSGAGTGLTGTATSLTIGGYANYISAQTNPIGVFNVGLTRPKGASYTTTASSVTGAIKIKMPPGTPVHGMWKMTIKVYEYGSRGNGYTIECGCHLYPSTAYNRYQYAIGVDSNIALTIRYGTDGTSGCIWIGENATTWSYPQIHVTEFSNGFNNPGSVDWNAGTWGVTIGTIDNSVAVDGPYTIGLPLASTATTLQTARLIGGVSFNGSADITLPGVNSGGNQNTSGSSASCTGNAATATILQTGRTINGTSFNGSAAITTANWGTARTLTIGSTGKSVDGSAAVSWSLAELGAAATNQTMFVGTTSIAINRASASQTLTGVSIDGNAANITAYTINQNVGSSNSPTFVTLQLTRLNFGATGAAPYLSASGEGFGNGITFGGDENSAAYRIFTGMENIGGNYSKLTFNWHTGIRIGAYTGYGGIRFYNNVIGSGTEIFSVGNTDNNVRVVNSLIVNGITINQERATNARMYGATTGTFGLLGVDSAGSFRWQIYGDGSNYGFLDSTWGNWDIQKAVNGQLDLRVSGATVRVLNAGNYQNYALPLTGGTLTGALNGTTASFSGNVKGGRVTLRDDCLEQHVDDSDSVGIFVNYFGYNSGTTRFRNFGVFNGKNQQLLYITGSTGATAITGTLAVSSAITQGGSQVLHAGNVATYALPIGGGTLTGPIYTSVGGTSIFIGNQNVTTSNGLRINFHTDADLSYYIGKKAGAWTQPLDINFYTGIRLYASSSYDYGISFWNSNNTTKMMSVGEGDSNVRVVNTLYIGGNTALHTANYNSYALPLSGGTLTGGLSGTTGTFSGTLTASGDLTILNLIGSYQNTSVYNSANTLSTTPSRGIRAQSSSIQFTDSYAIAPFYTYRTTGDWPVPYGIGWGTGGESSGIFQRYAANGYSFGDMIFYTGNDSYGAFSFRRHTWEGTTYFAAGSHHLDTELFRVDWSGNLTMLGTLNGSANSATLYPNNGSYGSWKIGGTKGGWYGLEFESGSIVMANSAEVGFYRVSYGWQFWWSNGTAYCMKGSPGGGTQAVILDSSNVASYALPIGGGTLTGSIQLPAGGYIGLNGASTYGIGVLASNRGSGVFDTLESTGSDPLELNYYQGGPVKIGSGANGSKALYAVGIYDNGNQVLHAGNYGGYSAFSGAISGTELTLSGQGMGAYNLMKYSGLRSGDWQTFTNTEGQLNVIQVNAISSGAHTNYPTGVYTYGAVMSWRTTNHSFQLYASHTGDLAYKTQWQNDNYSGWRRILDSTNYPYAAAMNQNVGTSNSPTFASLVITSEITIQKNNARNLLVKGAGGADCGILGLGSGDQFAFQLYGNNNSEYGFLNSAWGGWDLRKVPSGSLFLNGNVTYYLNPASLTNLLSLTVANTISGSITGNAATATSLTNFTNQSGTRFSTDFNSIVTTGFFNAEATPANAPSGFTYAQLISAKGIDTGLQIAGGYTNDNLWFRGWGPSLTFTGWRKLLHDGNYGGYSTFSGIVSSASGGFQTATYAAGRNRIWTFGNADGYGINYYQGSGGISGNDVIGLNFGNATAALAQFQFLASGSFNATGTITATNFSGPGSNLTGTASGLNIGGNAASASSLAADTSTRFKILTFTGVGGDSGNGALPDSYAIYQQGGSWTHPYPDLCIGYHTGIKIGAYYGYGGTRFYNNSDWATEIFSVGNGDNNVRVVNTIYAAAFSGPLTGNVTGNVTGSSGSCTGNAANVTGTVAIANGGTGATSTAAARTNLGATTVGGNLLTLTNPSAITFLRVNADNTVSALNASDFRTAIGAGGGGVTIETSLTQSLSGTTGCTIDVAAANVHILSLANTTIISGFTYNNRSSGPSVNTLMIVIKYAGNVSITWTNVVWSNGITPTLTQIPDRADVFMLTSYKGGAGTPVWIGTVVAAGLVSTNL